MTPSPAPATRDDDLDQPIEIAPRVWWVGQMIPGDRFQCHPYLIEQGDQSVLIDPGSALIAGDIVRKIDQVVGVENVRWLVCSHADPDIIGALPALIARGLHPQARIVTHWRDRALIVHSGTPLPYWLIEEHDWRLDLADRAVRFIFSPYLHFAGAFGTFDESTGTFFSGDLFGGFTDAPSLYAPDLSYFTAIRAFHEHYMPEREIMAHTLGRLRELPVTLIAPQHGQIIREELIRPMIDRLEKLETGVYLLAREDHGLRFLLLAHHVMKGLTEILVQEREFGEALQRIDALARQTLGATSLEMWVPVGPARLHFDALDGFAGRPASWPDDVAAAAAGSPHYEGTRLVWPLNSLDGERITGVAVVNMPEPMTLAPEARDVLDQASGLVEVRLEREIMRLQTEGERSAWRNRALHDTLTGVLNREALASALPQYVADDDQGLAPRLALLMIDIDLFKAVNDEWGHGVGDRVLAHVANAVRRSVRPADLVFRYGGEEFLVLLIDVDLETALSAAQRLRAAVASVPTGLPAVTVSVGVALRDHGEEGDDVVARADAALYAAKRAGRDRIEIAPST